MDIGDIAPPGSDLLGLEECVRRGQGRGDTEEGIGGTDLGDLLDELDVAVGCLDEDLRLAKRTYTLLHSSECMLTLAFVYRQVTTENSAAQ